MDRWQMIVKFNTMLDIKDLGVSTKDNLLMEVTLLSVN